MGGGQVDDKGIYIYLSLSLQHSSSILVLCFGPAVGGRVIVCHLSAVFYSPVELFAGLPGFQFRLGKEGVQQIHHIRGWQ